MNMNIKHPFIYLFILAFDSKHKKRKSNMVKWWNIFIQCVTISIFYVTG